VDMDGRAIDKVLAMRLPPVETENVQATGN